MSEQKLQSKILDWLQANGFYARKVIKANKAGVLDIFGCTPRGNFYAIEVKYGSNEASELQKYNITEIRKRNGIAFVAWDLETVIYMLQGEIMKVVVNVGHGYGDPGAVNKELGVTENGFNRELAALIQKMLPVSVVVMEQDASGLNGLVKRINEINPAFVVSLHSNAAENKTATGTETLYWHTSATSKRLAEIMQAELVAVLDLQNRGVKPRDNLAILRGTKCPAVIVEPFFISNNEDYKEAKLAKVDMAKAVVRGIYTYVGERGWTL